MKITFNTTSTGKTGFGTHYINADIGASSLEGSLKMRVLDENGNSLNTKKDTVFNKDDKRTEDLFEKRVAEKIIKFKNENEDLIRSVDPENETKVTVCYPGPVTDKGVRLTNFSYDDLRYDKFKRCIDTSEIDANLLKANTINLSSSKHVNDMAAAGTSLLSKLKEMDAKGELADNVLQEGKEILYLYPGGGLGSGVIMIDKDANNNRIYKIKPTEKQHVIDRCYQIPRILEDDACSPGLIRNFVATIAYEKSKLAHKKGRIKADFLGLRQIEIENNLKAKFNNNTMLVDYPVNKAEYGKAGITDIDDTVLKNANYFAMNAAMKSFAQIIASQVCDKNTNTVIIAGNIGNAIKKSVNNNDCFKQGKYKYIADKDRFDEILKDKVHDNLMAIGDNLMGENKNFNILTIPLKDNTEGEHLLHNGWQVGQKSASWFNIADSQQENSKRLAVEG